LFQFDYGGNSSGTVAHFERMIRSNEKPQATCNYLQIGPDYIFNALVRSENKEMNVLLGVTLRINYGGVGG
jgi:hypothetical protein